MKFAFILSTLLMLLTTNVLAEHGRATPSDNHCCAHCATNGGSLPLGGAVIGSIAITGQKQGPFASGIIDVVGFSHDIVSPRDAASGLPTGKRQHKPFTVRIPIGAAAPLLMNALTSNENLTKVTINLYKPGTTTVATAVTLTNANVADFSNQCNTGYADCESIAFTYQKIEWTWVATGITALDDWEMSAP